jgi:hypothetical protein
VATVDTSTLEEEMEALVAATAGALIIEAF